MPLLVPIHEPSTIIKAALGKYFDNKYVSLVAATACSLQFFDERFNLQTYSVAVASPVCSIGTIKYGDRDAIVVCLEDGRVEIVKYSQDRSCFVSELVLQIEEGPDKLQVLCANDDNSIVLVKSSSPSQLLVLRAGKTIKASLFGGRWGKIFDACFLSNDKVCMIENDPSTNPQLGLFSLSTKGLTVENTVALISMDPYHQLRVCPISEGILVYDFQCIQNFNFDGELTHSVEMPVFCVVATKSGIFVSSKNGDFLIYDQSHNTLKKIGKLENPPTNLVSNGNLAFSWGSGNPTQVIEVDSASVIRTLPTLGPVIDIIPLLETRPGKVLTLTSSVFEFECYDSCFSTLSRLDFGIPASHVASVDANINPSRIIKLDNHSLIFSTTETSIVFDVTEKGMREMDSFLFYNLCTETLAGNAMFQVGSSFIKTAADKIDLSVSCACVSPDRVIIAYLDEIKIYDANLRLEFSHKTENFVVLVTLCENYTVWASDSSVFICDQGKYTEFKSYPLHGVTDIAVCNGLIFIGDREGKIRVYTGDMQQVQQVIHVLSGPIKFHKLAATDALFAHGDKILRVGTKGNNICYELVYFNQKVGTLACVNDGLILTTRQDTVDLWSLDGFGMASVNTVGAQESIDAMLRCGEHTITASRDGKDLTKFHLYRWSQDLSHSELIYTLEKPDEIVEQILWVEFDGFEGLLVALNHSIKDECHFLLLDLKNLQAEPQSVKIGTGMIVKMVTCKHLEAADKAQVYFLNSSFLGAMDISIDGFKLTVLDKKVYVGRNFDILDDEALLFDYFEKSELCSLTSKSLRHKLWLEDTQETTTGLILPPTRSFPQRSYLIATESRLLYQFEAREDELKGNMANFGEKITTMCRLSLENPGPYAVDALMGSANGGLYAYFRLPAKVEQDLALLTSEIRKQNRALCQSDEYHVSTLIQWRLLRDLNQGEVERLCSELGIDSRLVEQARASINALLF